MGLAPVGSRDTEYGRTYSFDQENAIETNIASALYGDGSGEVTCQWGGYNKNAGTIWATYGESHHGGIDFASSKSNAPIYSVTNGTVAFVNHSSSTLGIYDSANDKTIVYMHANFDSGLEAGQEIIKGQNIGTEAGNGLGTGVHTHIEVQNGVATSAVKDLGISTIQTEYPYEYWNDVLSGNISTAGNASFSSGESFTGEVISSDSDFTPEDFVMSDFFADVSRVIEEQTITVGSDGRKTYDDSSLSIVDMRGVLGIPHQFLPLTDPRIDEGTTQENGSNRYYSSTVSYTSVGDPSSIGRLYADKIIKHIPLLLITPGTPSFMTAFSNEQKEGVVGMLGGLIDKDTLGDLINENTGKYYSLEFAYVDYFYYTNTMLRAAAIFLGIQDETLLNGKPLSSFNWLYNSTNPDGDGTDMFGTSALRSKLGSHAGCLCFYADCGNTVDDSFSNSTGASQLASSINSLSDQGRELNFLINNVGGAAGLQLDTLTGKNELDEKAADIQQMVKSAIGGNSVIGSILSKASTVMAGGRMIFPEIWNESSFSRSYSCKMKLISPSGDKLSIYLNILVPIYHLLALTLPRQSSGQTYFSPFLVRAYCKSLFNVDMGIITNLDISKGSEGEWTQDGLPTVADVSFQIKDLYDGMFMSKGSDWGPGEGIMSNITELDYIANSCGININDHEIGRTIKMFLAFNTKLAIKDQIELGIFGNFQQFFAKKIQNIFGMF